MKDNGENMMISYIKGCLERIGEDFIIIDNQGIGYKICVSGSTIDKLPSCGEDVKIYTFMNVKEDGISLYGFYTIDELDLFNYLIGVSGVGPKGALSFLNTFEPSEIIMAIVSEDIQTLSKISGVGKKTAQRVILELKDKFKNFDFFKSFSDENKNDGAKVENIKKNSAKLEAIEALSALGYSRSESVKAVGEVYEDSLSVEQLLKKSLKAMIK